MNEYKSIQDLIVKAALYDGVSTTISPDQLANGIDILRITFRKGDIDATAYIDTVEGFRNHEDMVLYSCKRVLRDLLFAPYEGITVNKENQNG